MVPSKLLKLGLALASVVSISACIPGGSGGDGDDNEGNFLTGSSAATAVASPIADGDIVTLAWSASLNEDDLTSATFVTQLFVSNTPVAGNADYSVSQLVNSNGISLTASGTASCSYAATGSLSCVSGGVTAPSVDISAVLASGNGSAYLMARTCITGSTICTALTGTAAPLLFEFGRSYTDVLGDAALTHVDLVKANINGDDSVMNMTLTVDALQSLTINNGGSSGLVTDDIEYEWSATFDANGSTAVDDNDYGLALVHRINSTTSSTTTAADTAHFVGEVRQMTAGVWTVFGPASVTVDTANNTITVSAATPAGVTPATNAVRFDAIDNSGVAAVADAIPDAGGSNYLN